MASQRLKLGLCEDYTSPGTSLAQVHRQLEMLERLGLRALRVSLSWNELEPQPGRYCFDFIEPLVESAGKHEVELLPCICNTPQWNSDEADGDFWTGPPVDYEAFARLTCELAGRYRGLIHSWEIWNEPDNPSFWAGSTGNYARLLDAGSRGVRLGNPEARVVLGGISWNTQFLLTLFRDHNAGRLVDVVNIHNYYEAWIDEPAERIVDYVDRVADIVDQYGHGHSIWMAKVGYSTYRHTQPSSGSYEPYYPYERTPEYQAIHVIRTMASLLSTERLETIAWYEIRDLMPEAHVIGSVDSRALGITTSDLDHAPVLKALNLTLRLFRDAHRCIDDEVMVARPARSDSQVHLFERADRTIIIIAWLQTYVPGRRRRQKEGGEDTREEVVEISLALEESRRIRMYDSLGAVRRESRLRVVDGRACLRALIRGGEVTVIEVEP